ncbi:nucleotide exchange factor GrpE [Geofilum rubicundum]|uniref:Protein GrpE n=1 Tax=Geofilum rubicundum JCM 15548 TaxID=1236989 RepID=A0A0E9M1T5_9BACT|nr:nucleotide exchange factor GrpE [Geofilum rubicundum]GAO31125.1 heat shock protein GrpE [Geofilum rubicundum JCM 15548]
MTRKSSKEKGKEQPENKEQELESMQTEQASNQEDVVSEEDPIEEETVEEEQEDEERASDDADEACEDQVSLLKKQLVDLNDKHLRLVAEYDNYRKRTLKEKMELTKIAGERIFVNILPVIDDFERAIQHLGSASDLDSVKGGIDLIYNKFVNYLSQQGVKAIDTSNQDFDADVHEAITKIPAPSEEMKGKVIDCLEKGYLLDDKVIRFPKVVVGE